MLHFLRPGIWKFLLGLVLFAVSSLLWRTYITSRISDTFPHGFPFQFYMAWGPCPPGEICSEFSGLYLALDLVLWYMVSAFLIDRIQKRA